MELKKLVRKVFGKLAGINKVQEQADAAFYFLNRYLDITKAPKAEGPLREMQLCDYALLRIFHKVCEKNNLTYWLDYGTLLGAVRHKGFIPWDDDMDVSMPREDFDRAKIILKEATEKFGLTVNCPDDNEHSRLGFSYRHNETGIWMDIFPVDYVTASENSEEEKTKIKERVLKYSTKFRRRYKNWDKIKVDQKRDELTRGSGFCEMMVHGMEFKHTKWIVIEKEKVVPCAKAVFEEDRFCVPADYQTYLTAVFGENYMNFPKSGLEHHGGDQGLLSTWASKHNINMQEVYTKLTEIYEMI